MIISRKRITQMRVLVERMICIVINRRQLRKQQAGDKQCDKSSLPECLLVWSAMHCDSPRVDGNLKKYQPRWMPIFSGVPSSE